MILYKWRLFPIDASWIGVPLKSVFFCPLLAAMFERRQTLPEMAYQSHSLSPMITLNDLVAVVEEEQRQILELLGGGHGGFH